MLPLFQRYKIVIQGFFFFFSNSVIKSLAIPDVCYYFLLFR